MEASSPAPDPDYLPLPRIDGTLAVRLWDPESVRRPRVDWRSTLLSLLTHLLFVALIFALAHWMGKEAPDEPPSIEVQLAPDPEPPPPPPPPAPRREVPQPPAPPPPPQTRASEASSVGEGAPAAAKQNETPSAAPAQKSVAPRIDEPAPRAEPTAREAAPEPAPPQAAVEPLPPAPPLPEEVEPAPIPAPPVLSAPQAPPTARPAPAPRPAPPPPSLALKKPTAPAHAQPGELKPQVRRPESEAPAPSPQGDASAPAGPLPAVYDPYLAAVRDRAMEHRSLLRAYFGTSRVAAAEIEIELDQAGRFINHDFRVSTRNPNLDDAILKMLALAAPYPPPPIRLAPGHNLQILLIIPFPASFEDWKQAYYPQP
jgi:outer membrane biosynthesis protein TonB